MKIDQIIEKLSAPLLGWEAQKHMSPAYRNPLKREEVLRLEPKRAGVVVHLYPKEGLWYVSYIKRSAYEGVHSAQIAFPGGRYEPTDADLKQTAFREAREEVGLMPRHVVWSGRLSWLYIPPSNFYVEPVVSVGQEAPHWRLDPIEVAQLIEVPLAVLLSGELECSTSVHTGSFSYQVPAYAFEGEHIWGATAIITAELVAMLR